MCTSWTLLWFLFHRSTNSSSTKWTRPIKIAASSRKWRKASTSCLSMLVATSSLRVRLDISSASVTAFTSACKRRFQNLSVFTSASPCRSFLGISLTMILGSRTNGLAICGFTLLLSFAFELHPPVLFLSTLPRSETWIPKGLSNDRACAVACLDNAFGSGGCKNWTWWTRGAPRAWLQKEYPTVRIENFEKPTKDIIRSKAYQQKTLTTTPT